MQIYLSSLRPVRKDHQHQSHHQQAITMTHTHYYQLILNYIGWWCAAWADVKLHYLMTYSILYWVGAWSATLARLTWVAVYVEAVHSPFARQPNGLRAVTHTKARGGLIAQLIDLHQRSQGCARKGRERLPWHHRMLQGETRRASQGTRLIPTLREAVCRKERQSVRGKHTYTHTEMHATVSAVSYLGSYN